MSWLRRLFRRNPPPTSAMVEHVKSVYASSRERRYHGSDQFGR